MVIIIIIGTICWTIDSIARYESIFFNVLFYFLVYFLYYYRITGNFFEWMDICIDKIDARLATDVLSINFLSHFFRDIILFEYSQHTHMCVCTIVRKYKGNNRNCPPNMDIFQLIHPKLFIIKIYACAAETYEKKNKMQ